LVKERVFSLYDMEQVLREAGAERVNERAVVSLAEEMENTVNEILSEAEVYANYAGRTRLINDSDVSLCKGGQQGSQVVIRSALAKHVVRKRTAQKRKARLNNVVEERMLAGTML
jgi:histone H3/H4